MTEKRKPTSWPEIVSDLLGEADLEMKPRGAAGGGVKFSPVCRWCGRDYAGDAGKFCSSDDCPGYKARAALAAELLADVEITQDDILRSRQLKRELGWDD